LLKPRKLNKEVGMAEKGYCVKCKTMKEMKEEQKVVMKNKRQAVKGKCPDCGTGMYRILGKA
jgi:nitrate/TMAO reductase-like tetraheme cytochrome c subunit